MAGEITLDAVNGLSKKVYDKKIHKVQPVGSILQKRFNLEKGNRIGDTYQVPVVLRMPNGFTYEGSDGAVVTLNSPKNMVIKQAAITPFAKSLREQVTITTLSRLAEQGEGVIAGHVGEMMIAMRSAMSTRVEACSLLGQMSYGTVESVVDHGSNQHSVTFTAKTWAPGLWWAVGEGARFDSFQSGGTARSSASTPMEVVRITSSTRTVRFSYTGTSGGNAAANDTFHPAGARTGAATYKEMPGLLTQASNTAGTSLGLDAGTYGNWGGNVKAINGTPDHGTFEDCFGELRDRGAEGKLVAVVSNKLWSTLATQLDVLRGMDSSYTAEKGKLGFKALSYATDEYGEVELLSHPFMPWGYSGIFPEAEIERLGSSDINFGLPGVEDSPFWERVANTNAAELQCYTDQCIVLKKPAHSYLLTDITFS